MFSKDTENWNSWNWQLRNRIHGPEDFPEGFSLLPEEAEYFASCRTSEEKGIRTLEFSVTPYYFSLAGGDPDDPVRRQFLPRSGELHAGQYELGDPLGEGGHTPVPRLIHRYRDRALLLANDSCAMYCRHCFRRSYTSSGSGAVSREALEAICAYLSGHREIRELLLSGGDPLILEDQKLGDILRAVRTVRPDMMFRIGTRAPVTLPQRITGTLVQLLKEFSPLWIATQFNHPRELSEEAVAGITALVDAGIPVLNQTVLLKGVNDSADVLEELFRNLTHLRVKPYYLFQGDLAVGTGHLRAPLKSGLAIMRELRGRLSGIALPVYAVDLPGGGGKIPLTESYLESEEDGFLVFRSTEGKLYRYPLE